MPGNNYNILIVDDSLFIIKQLTQILTSEGYTVIDTAENGEEAVEKYEKLRGQVDLITLDVTMAKMNGLECLKKIKEIDPDIKVIMISAIGRQDLVKQCLLIGASNYIVKPLNRGTVLERIQNVLG